MMIDEASALKAALDLEDEERGNAADDILNADFAARVVEVLHRIGFRIVDEEAEADRKVDPAKERDVPFHVLTPAQRRLLAHLQETGGWMPGVDPVTFSMMTIESCVRKGWARWDCDGRVLQPTPEAAFVFPWKPGG